MKATIETQADYEAVLQNIQDLTGSQRALSRSNVRYSCDCRRRGAYLLRGRRK